MKKLFLLAILGLVFSAFRFQNDTDAIIASLKSADAQQTGKYFDAYVDIKLLDKDEVKSMGRNQATLALKAFFAETGVNGFEKLSERELGNTMYLAGKLLNGGKGYNITIMLRVKDGRRQIITLRIS